MPAYSSSNRVMFAAVRIMVWQHRGPMTQLHILHGDVLNSKADGLVVPFDGTLVPGEGEYDRILGNVGRQFMRRFPEVDLLDEMEAQIDFPVALGHARALELDAGPFRTLILVSTLHHIQDVDASAKRAIVRASVASAIRVAQQQQLPRVAAPVLQGGWRLEPDVAFIEMLKAVDGSDASLTVLVYCNDTTRFQHLESIARAYGFGPPSTA